MPSSVPCRRVCFGPFEADLRSGELRRDGVKVRLQEQPFHVLAVLLERPGDVVTREELHSRLWPADTLPPGPGRPRRTAQPTVREGSHGRQAGQELEADSVLSGTDPTGGRPVPCELRCLSILQHFAPGA
jgi:hypothetical protein